MYNNSGYEIKSSPDVNAICEVPTSAVFEMCAEFETERNYSTDKNRNYIPNPVITTDAIVGVPRVDLGYSKYGNSYYSIDNYYYGNDNSNPFWDHKAEKTCFKRTIDPVKYSYGY